MLYVLDRNYQSVGILSNDSPKSCHYFNDKHREAIDSNVNLLEFEIPANNEMAHLIKTDGFIIHTDLDGIQDLYMIKETVYRKDGTETLQVLCEHGATADLIGHIIRPQVFNAYSLQDIIEVILGGTGWQLKSVISTQVKDIEFSKYMTALEALHEVLDLFDCEMYYEVNFNGTDITGKYVNAIGTRGQITNKVFEYGKDLQSVERTEDSRELITALIAVGADGLTLEGYLPTLPDGIVLEQDFLYSEDALQRYGRGDKHIFGIFEDTSIKEVGVLYEKALAKLQELSVPSVTYDCSVATLERISGYEHEEVRIGDTVIVKDFTVNPVLILQARVVDLTRSNSDPAQDRVVLGDYKRLGFKQSYDLHKIQQQINQVDTSVIELTDTVTTNTTSITQNSQEIALKASQTDLDLATGRITQAETDIIQNAQSITLKADQSTVDSLGNTVSSNTSSIQVNAQGISLNSTEISNVEGRVSQAETDISQNAYSISLKASQSYVDGIEGRVTQAESDISVNAGNISLKVSETDYNGATIASKINLDASTITIDAQAIDLYGITTVNDTLNVGYGSNVGRINFSNSSYIKGDASAFSPLIEFGCRRADFTEATAIWYSNVDIHGSNTTFKDNVIMDSTLDVGSTLTVSGNATRTGYLDIGYGSSSFPTGTNGRMFFGSGYAGRGLYLYDGGWRFVAGSGA